MEQTKPEIHIEVNDNQEPVVSGRMLHEALEVNTPYHKWMPRMMEYGFIENQDYIVTDIFVPNLKGGKQYQKNHVLKLDMAKEIAMIQRTEKGKEVRQYFIQVEKDFNSPEKIMARALKLADNQISDLKGQIEEQKPKVIFANAVGASDTSILVGDLAKIIRQNGVNIGQNRLFAWLRQNGFLINRKGESWNMPTQRSMDMELFEVKERTHNNPDGSIRISKTTKVTGKGQVYFINKFVKDLKLLEV